MFLRMLETDPMLYLALVGAVILSVVLHELGHGLAATWQGDPTPRMLGHLTWNPVVHMKWTGLALLAVFGIAFGSTPVEPRNFRNRRWGDTMVSFAGPAVNLVIWMFMVVTLVAMLLIAPPTDAGVGAGLFQFGYMLATLNLLLFVFNMIPVPPFDGYTVAKGFVNFGDLGRGLERAGAIPMIIVFVIVMQTDVLDWVYGVTAEVVRALVVTLRGGA